METLTLKAETSRLLDLVIHSLYTRPELFLRELMSNASDALDRLRFESMLDPSLIADDQRFEIRLEVDCAARTLTVSDTGIGMSREEVVNHIGTIALSGTQEFLSQIKPNADRSQMVDLIGRFGVGFYSCFMVAEKVTLLTRRAGEEIGTRWESAGDVHYTVTDAAVASRGTSVTLHLKPVDAETGLEDYTDRWVLSRIVKRYADFVHHPISYHGPSQEVSEQPNEPRGVAAVSVVLNSMKPIWTRPASEVKPEEYDEFYKHISHDWSSPLLRMAFKAEGRWEYATLLYVPSQAPHDLYYHAVSFGLQLYSQRVLIAENCQELLPRYLRFMKGVVDAADLPLNVSRQSLQHANHLINIRKWLSRKVVDTLNKLRQSDAEKYLTFWRQFGRALKEGISEDYEQKSRLIPLLLFESSHHASDLTSLADYLSRMKPDQKDIFYLVGPSRAILEASPHLEQVRAKGYEVLYLTEAVDELVVQSLHEFEGRRLRSAAKGRLDLSDDSAGSEPEQQAQKPSEQFGDLLKCLATHLASRVRDVRISTRLTTSPACIVSEEYDLSPHIDRILNGKAQANRRTLELNPRHPIVLRLQDQFSRDREAPLIASAADLLLGMALLAEGSELPDSAGFANRVGDLLAGALASPLSTDAPESREEEPCQPS